MSIDRYKQVRRVCRISIEIGIASGAASFAPLLAEKDAMIGLFMLSFISLTGGAGFYYRVVNRCPACQKKFSDAAKYQSDEMSGVPLFQRIEACPFCKVAIDQAA